MGTATTAASREGNSPMLTPDRPVSPEVAAAVSAPDLQAMRRRLLCIRSSLSSTSTTTKSHPSVPLSLSNLPGGGDGLQKIDHEAYVALTAEALESASRADVRLWQGDGEDLADELQDLVAQLRSVAKQCTMDLQKTAQAAIEAASANAQAPSASATITESPRSCLGQSCGDVAPDSQDGRVDMLHAELAELRDRLRAAEDQRSVDLARLESKFSQSDRGELQIDEHGLLLQAGVSSPPPGNALSICAKQAKHVRKGKEDRSPVSGEYDKGASPASLQSRRNALFCLWPSGQANTMSDMS